MEQLLSAEIKNIHSVESIEVDPVNLAAAWVRKHRLNGGYLPSVKVAVEEAFKAQTGEPPSDAQKAALYEGILLGSKGPASPQP